MFLSASVYVSDFTQEKASTIFCHRDLQERIQAFPVLDQRGQSNIIQIYPDSSDGGFVPCHLMYDEQDEDL